MQRSPELEELAREMIDAMQASDVPRIEQTLARVDGAVMIGTEAAEYTRDMDEMMKIMRESTPDQGYHITVSLDEVRGYQEGDVGWIDGTGKFERDGQSVDVRMTGVAHREAGQWRFLQTHASIGVPNERMFEPMFQRQAAASGG
jgi:hypothetical protein